MTLNGHHINLDWKVNIVSAINLIALLGLLLTAISTWYGLVGRVDQTQSDMRSTAAESKESRAKVSELLTSFLELQKTANDRLTRVESAIEFQTKSIERLEKKIDGP